MTSPTSGGRSVGIVRSRTQTMEFSFSFSVSYHGSKPYRSKHEVAPAVYMKHESSGACCRTSGGLKFLPLQIRSSAEFLCLTRGKRTSATNFQTKRCHTVEGGNLKQKARFPAYQVPKAMAVSCSLSSGHQYEANRNLDVSVATLPCWLASWIIILPWRWRQHVPPKHRLTFNGPHGLTSLYMEHYKLLHFFYFWDDFGVEECKTLLKINYIRVKGRFAMLFIYHPLFI
jgi:hypothetical protein